MSDAVYYSLLVALIIAAIGFVGIVLPQIYKRAKKR
jgi:hypothetical protein